MNRRDPCIALVALAALPLGLGAQQPGRVYRMGRLISVPLGRTYPEWVPSMAKLGWVVDQNLILVERSSNGSYERLPELAAELVRLNVDVIWTLAAPETEAAKQATKTIPIVFYLHGDPVGRGHVASLAKPGGNITGTSQMMPERTAKRVSFLKQLLPGATRVAVLWNDANPAKLLDWKATQDAAAALSLGLDSFGVKGPEDFQAAFDAIRRARPDALMTLDDPLTYTKRAATVEFAASARLPAVYAAQDYVEIGGLLSSYPPELELVRLNVYYLDRILRGAKPADLPVQHPTIFTLAVNLKTAKALNLTIPQALLALADVVIS
jgi:putative ABC transport system substrate-binding protein